jgi:PleD family two-component response regulator
MVWSGSTQPALPPLRLPLALIASSHEWLVRSFESVLSTNGFAVLRAYTPAQAQQQARAAEPDAIFLDVGLSAAPTGVELCRTLRADPRLAPAVPIFLITSGSASRAERLDALRAGAWEIFGLPLDGEELMLKLRTYVAGKLDADRARDESLIDLRTGFYNVRGLLRRAQEIGSDAARHHRALACIMLSPDEGGATTAPAALSRPLALDRLSKLIKESCRASDALGRLGQHEFVILAPNTDPKQALDLTRRLTAAAERCFESAAPHPVRIRAGLFAVPDFHAAAIQPVDLLVRATIALRRSQSAQSTESIQSFEMIGAAPLA